MPTLTLPDASTIELPEGEPVGAALPKGTIAARVDGELRDLSFVPAGTTTRSTAAGARDADTVISSGRVPRDGY